MELFMSKIITINNVDFCITFDNDKSDVTTIKNELSTLRDSIPEMISDELWDNINKCTTLTQLRQYMDIGVE
jgi:hypothetical protein